MRVHEIRATREQLHRANLCHEEFLVFTALMFWAFGQYSYDISKMKGSVEIRPAFLKLNSLFFRRLGHGRGNDPAG